MRKNYETCYNTLSSLAWYESKWHMVFIIFYSLFSLLSHHFIPFFFGSDLMGGFDSGCLFSLPFTLATPPDVDLCVFCCCFCFCFSVVVVLVFYCGGSGVRRWWGVDGCRQWGWAVSCGGGGWFFYFVFLYIVGFFNVILILVYIILMYRIKE